jgi:hypothetical protein
MSTKSASTPGSDLNSAAGSADLGLVEKLLVGAGGAPWEAVYRVAVGFVTLPAASLVWGEIRSWWVLGTTLVGVLLMLRVVTFAIRRLVPFSGPAQHIWAQRRDLARCYDSYQWQKLFWIGLGLAAYSILFGQFRDPGIVVSVFCLLSGAAGLATWRSNRRANSALGRLVNQQDF